MSKYGKSRPEKKLVIQVPGDVKRITTLDLAKKLLLDWSERRRIGKKSAISPNGFTPDMDRMSDISHLAIIVDGEVVDVMRAQARLTSILLAKPEFVRFDPQATQVRAGDKYEDGKIIQRKVENPLKPQDFKLDRGASNED